MLVQISTEENLTLDSTTGPGFVGEFHLAGGGRGPRGSFHSVEELAHWIKCEFEEWQIDAIEKARESETT